MNLNTKRILLVEDDDGCVSVFQFDIGRKAEVIVASTVDDVLQAFQQRGPFDLIVMDGYISGNADTTELTRLISTQFNGPIIANSANPDQQARLMEAGCSHHNAGQKGITARMALRLLGIRSTG